MESTETPSDQTEQQASEVEQTPQQNLDEAPDQNLTPANQESTDDSNQEPEASLNKETSSQTSSSSSNKKFWKSWSKQKKVLFALGTFFGTLLILLLTNLLLIKPSKTSNYLNNSWHDLVLASSDIDRAVSSEVNLAGTRNLADGLYGYNQRLGSLSFEARGKNSFWYNSGTTKQYSSVADDMRNYFSAAATTLAKSSDDITTITDQELDDLGGQGQQTKKIVDEFRAKHKLQEDFNPSLFTLDNYIREVKSAYEKIEKEKKEEEAKKAQEAAEKVAKEAKDKSNVQAVSESYFTAFINGNEAGVRATLSKGFQNEYDYSSLKAERRTDFFPKSYRIVSVDKDGDNYKVTASVTYVSRYTDASGNQQEVINPVSMIYRVVFATDTSSWKVDGQLER